MEQPIDQPNWDKLIPFDFEAVENFDFEEQHIPNEFSSKSPICHPELTEDKVLFQ